MILLISRYFIWFFYKPALPLFIISLSFVVLWYPFFILLMRAHFIYIPYPISAVSAIFGGQMGSCFCSLSLTATCLLPCFGFFFLLGSQVSWGLFSAGTLWGLGFKDVSSEKICECLCQVPLPVGGQFYACVFFSKHVSRINSVPKPKGGWACGQEFPWGDCPLFCQSWGRIFLVCVGRTPLYAGMANLISYLAQAQTLSPVPQHSISEFRLWVDQMALGKLWLQCQLICFSGIIFPVPSNFWRFSSHKAIHTLKNILNSPASRFEGPALGR